MCRRHSIVSEDEDPTTAELLKSGPQRLGAGEGAGVVTRPRETGD